MTRLTAVWLVALASPLMPGALVAESPVPVTPASGATERFLSVPCPIFHWVESAGTGAEQVELVVRRLGPSEGAVAAGGRPVLRQFLPAGFGVWQTPASRCLTAPGVYTWQVRGLSPDGPGGWSAEAVFEVPSLAGGMPEKTRPLPTKEGSGRVDLGAKDPTSGAESAALLETSDAQAASFLPGTAAFQVDGDASIGGDVAVGGDETQARLHVRGLEIEIPTSFLQDEELLVEDGDAVVGIYSTNAGSAGSALVLGETVDGSFITSEKWGIVRETDAGGGDLRFTVGMGANYFTNPTQFEIGNDGVLTGAGIPVAWGFVDDDGTVLSGSGNFTVEVISAPVFGNTFTIDIDGVTCSDNPIVVATAAVSNVLRAAQASCDPLSGAAPPISIWIFDSLGASHLEPFSFAAYLPR